MNLPNKRPENMERITTKALAEAFIDEQVREIRAQVGDKKASANAFVVMRSIFSGRLLGKFIIFPSRI